MMPILNRKKAGWCAIAVACVSGFEGLRTAAYLDPVSIPTACFGETKGIRMGQTFTVDQCKGMLADSLEIANRGVDSCVRTYLPDTRRAAFVSMTYNIGVANFCGSTLVRKLNAGDTRGACDEMLRWTRAKGIVLPGLVKRREAERQMCLQGLT
jgi:lysozyme